MIAMEKRPELDVCSVNETDLVVESTDISFQDLAGDSVWIRVRVHNHGSHPSRPTFMRLESAPLGAFVPWRPLTAVPVPELDPGETREISCEAARPRPATLGGFDRLPPSRLLIAINASPDESSPPPDARLAAIANLLRRPGTARPAGRGPAVIKGPSLPPDLMELVGQDQPHWAGNINVFIGSRSVERHLAKALRLYPGRSNLAMFLVGGAGRPEAYAFDLAGLTRAWQAALYDVTNARTLVVGAADRPIQQTQWVEGAGPLLIMLAVRPPDGCREGNVEVHVTRQSDQKTALVEFNLDPTAQGTGCYVV